MMKNYGIFVALLIILSSSCQHFFNSSTKQKKTTDSLSFQLRQKARYFRNKNIRDSAYFYAYKAYKVSRKKKDLPAMFSSLVTLTQLDYYAHNYPAAENSAYKAFRIDIKDPEKKVYIINFIGLINWKKGNYYDAEKHFKKIKKVLGKDFYNYTKIIPMYYNNLGLVNLDMQKNHTAIKYFDSLIEVKNIKQKLPLQYAQALNNKARALFNMKKFNQVFSLMQEALKIRKDKKDIFGETRSYEFFSKYYSVINDNKNALLYAEKALETAQHTDNPEEVLNALKLLGKIDTLNASKYFKKYIKLQEKLLVDERKFKEQSAKIRFETQQKENEIARQELIIKQNDKILQIVVIFLIVSLILSLLLYYQNRRIHSQKQRLIITNKKLQEQKDLLKSKNIQLEEKNEFINNLHREMRHRFSDNMGALEATIGQLLKNSEQNEQINHLLRKISGKITEIRLIQELLKYQGNSEAVNMKEFVEKLATSIQNIFDRKEILVKINVDPILLDMMQSKSLGAIINEFLTNSFKYAFDNIEDGEVCIKVKENNNGKIFVELSDNGKGLPKDMDFGKLKSRGIILIGLFIKKLKAELTYPDKKYLFNTKNGTMVSFVFNKHKLNL